LDIPPARLCQERVDTRRRADEPTNVPTSPAVSTAAALVVDAFCTQGYAKKKAPAIMVCRRGFRVKVLVAE